MTVTRYSSTDGGAPTITGQIGSFTTLMDALGVTGYGSKFPVIPFTTAYTGTNIRTYRQGSGTNQLYLGIDDTNAQNTRVRLFETASAAGVAAASGTGATPTEAQVSGGLYCYKSSTADGTARPWVAISNGKILYVFWSFSGLTTTLQGFYFGDIVSYKYADAYGTVLVGNIAASAVTTAIKIGQCSGTFSAVDAGWCIPRAYTQLAGAIQLSRCSDAFRSFNATEFGSGGCTYPSPMTSGLELAPVWVGEGLNGVRGHLPGLWAPMHARPFAHGDTCSGTGNLAGKTFEAVNIGSAGQLFIETSDTWS